MNFKAANICRAICKTSFGLAAPLFFCVCAHIHSGFIHIVETCTLKIETTKNIHSLFRSSRYKATWNANNMHIAQTRKKVQSDEKKQNKTQNFPFWIRTRNSLCVGMSDGGWMSQRRFDFFSGFVYVGVFIHKTRNAHFTNSYAASSYNFRHDLFHPIQCE